MSTTTTTTTRVYFTRVSSGSVRVLASVPRLHNSVFATGSHTPVRPRTIYGMCKTRVRIGMALPSRNHDFRVTLVMWWVPNGCCRRYGRKGHTAVCVCETTIRTGSCCVRAFSNDLSKILCFIKPTENTRYLLHPHTHTHTHETNSCLAICIRKKDKVVFQFKKLNLRL